MTTYYFVTATRTPGVTTSSPPYDQFDDALRGAAFMLGNGASEAWIVDREGNLVLPAEQVKLRLKSEVLRPSGPRQSEATRQFGGHFMST